MSNSMSEQYEDALTKVLQLSPRERLALLEEVAVSLKNDFTADEMEHTQTTPISDEELAELMRVEPLSPAEIAAEGLLGTWSDLNISDGAEWVSGQKRRRKERHKWSVP